MAAETLAVYGAAFNPPHAGHLNAIAQLLAQADRVLLVPSYQHAFGKQMAPFDQRLAMLKAALESSSLDIARLQVTPVEQTIASTKDDGEPVYSWDLLENLQRQYPDSQLFLAIGPDNADPAQWRKFYRYQDIDARWRKLVVAERLPVRSTGLREALASGREIDSAQLPVEVQHLIAQYGLYQHP